MFSELEEKAFVIIDDFLNELVTSKSNIGYFTYGKPNEYFLAKEMMEKYDLISYRNPGSYASIVDITQNGLSILKFGGIKKFLSETKQKTEEKEKLEYEKLNGEVIDIRNRIFDYESTKQRTIRSEWIAIISVAIAFISLISQLLCNKPR